MIGRLEGRLQLVDPGTVLVEAGGVGYLVSITLRAFQQLSGRDRTALWVRTRLKDDAIELYGFPERAELDAFDRLISVAGVGPRTAMAVLSGLTTAELAEAVDSSDVARLQKTPGVGKKTAQRIVLELKGRLDEVVVGAGGDQRGDAVSALINLGYPQREARRAVDAVLDDAAEQEIAEILRLALQRLTR
jgi:Holliday junction DNA helicase RuvA